MTTSNRTHSTGNARRSAGTPRMRRGRMGVAIQEGEVNYKDAAQMRRLINERGKIGSTRRTGATSKLQRQIAEAIKRARHLALIPMAPHHNHITESIQDASQRTQVVGTPAAEQSQEGNDAKQQAEAPSQATKADAGDSAGDASTEPAVAASGDDKQDSS